MSPLRSLAGKMLAARGMQKRREEKAEERQGNIKAAKVEAAEKMKGRAREAIEQFDADKDGVLCKAEVGNLVKGMAKSMGLSEALSEGGLSEEALESVVLHCTGDRDGTVAEIDCGGLIKTAQQRSQGAALVATACPWLPGTRNVGSGLL